MCTYGIIHIYVLSFVGLLACCPVSCLVCVFVLAAVVREVVSDDQPLHHYTCDNRTAHFELWRGKRQEAGDVKLPLAVPRD